jgi:hypothetical protein
MSVGGGESWVRMSRHAEKWLTWSLIAFAIAWLIGVNAIIPISADHYHAPASVKWIVTAGGIIALVFLLIPSKTKGRKIWFLCSLFVLYATMQVFVIWIWN